MQTFRKLPMTPPNAAANTICSAIGSSNVMTVAAGWSCRALQEAARGRISATAGPARPARARKAAPTGSSGNARPSIRAREHGPVAGGPPVSVRKGVDGILKVIDLIERAQLQESMFRVVAQPVVLGRLPNRFPHRRDDRRSPPSASVVAASDASHHGAPGRVRGAIEPLGGGSEVVAVPVMDEADVFHVLPLIGLFAQTLFEELDCQVRPARARRDRPPPETRSRTCRRC